MAVSQLHPVFFQGGATPGYFEFPRWLGSNSTTNKRRSPAHNRFHPTRFMHFSPHLNFPCQAAAGRNEHGYEPRRAWRRQHDSGLVVASCASFHSPHSLPSCLPFRSQMGLFYLPMLRRRLLEPLLRADEWGIVVLQRPSAGTFIKLFFALSPYFFLLWACVCDVRARGYWRATQG